MQRWLSNGLYFGSETEDGYPSKSDNGVNIG